VALEQALYPAAAARTPQLPQSASQSSTLWVLECIESKDRDASRLQESERLLRHTHKDGTPLLTMHRVGRLLQPDFFKDLVTDQKLLESVSREHFHIWAQQVATPDESQMSGVLCKVFLSNCSANGTMVNDRYLRAPGEQTQIHCGDIITLPYVVADANGMHIAPLIRFSFSMTGSMLRDAGNIEPASPPKVAELDDNVEAPTFFLEVGGPGLLDGVQPEEARIMYPKSLSTDLVLGRGEQTDFWKRVLCRKAYEMLSRKHLKIYRGDDTGSTVFVENIADKKQVFVFNALDGMAMQDSIVLRMHEKKKLRRGDIIIVNPSHDCVVWLLFFDVHESVQDRQTRSNLMSWECPEISACRAAAVAAIAGA
jgi:hypothetical protein